MELTINKKRMLKAIDELPEDATIEEGIERLVFLHKIQKGLSLHYNGIFDQSNLEYAPTFLAQMV